MIGLGLIENISETDILINADVNDINGDGISGKANIVWHNEKNDYSLVGLAGKHHNLRFTNKLPMPFFMTWVYQINFLKTHLTVLMCN